MVSPGLAKGFWCTALHELPSRSLDSFLGGSLGSCSLLGEQSGLGTQRLRKFPDFLLPGSENLKQSLFRRCSSDILRLSLRDPPSDLARREAGPYFPRRLRDQRLPWGFRTQGFRGQGV